MSIITIQCRLVAAEDTLCFLWELMAQKNTPLINELLDLIAQHSDLETWLQNNRLPTGFIKTLCNSLKSNSRFAPQPERFYRSAMTLVDYIYKSWFALQQRRQRQIEGKQRWLSMLKSDADLEEESNCCLDDIRTRATQLLSSLTAQSTPDNKAGNATPSVFNALFDAYELAQDILTRCALAYLLKNNAQVSQTEEDPEEFALRRRRKEIEIERLIEQIKARIPKGRDLTGEQWRITLVNATCCVPENNDEMKSWQVSLLRKTSTVPFPISYETSEDMLWTRNDKSRIFVRFNGLGEHTFEVYCDQRQLHWFQRFVKDQETKRSSHHQHSSSLFTLRSGRLSWQERQGRGEPWNIHRLILFCAVDTRLWTAEGTKLLGDEKASLAHKTLKRMEEKGELNSKQQAFVRRRQSTLTRINTPFPRPSKPTYQGQPHILVGVSFGLEKPATVAVVDVTKGKVLAYRSIKQLLGNQYTLLNRQRQQQQRLSHERHKAQKYGADNQFGESALGQHVDRLIATSVVAIATSYSAGSIVLPKLGDLREIVQSEMQAKAEKKFPGYKSGQQHYASEYRTTVHRWSYGRLMECIQNQAAQAGISIETGLQPSFGNPQSKARDLALFAYQCRTIHVK